MSDFLENLTSLTDNLGDIMFTQYATVVAVNEDKRVDCKEKETNTTHKNVINATLYEFDIDDTVILGFVDNSVYDPVIIGAVDGKANIKIEGYVKCDYLTQNYPNNQYVADNYSEKNHNHDLLYYGKSEVDTLLSNKSDVTHDHNNLYYIKSEVDSKISEHDSNFYSKSATDDLLNLKVDKVAGKSLSTEDYTSEEKTKLSGIESGANYYVHPSTHPSSIITGLTSNKDVVTDSNGLLATVQRFNYAISSSNYNPLVGGSVIITVQVSDNGGAVVSGHLFDLIINDTTTISLTTDSQGVATYSYTCDTEGICKFSVKTSTLVIYVKKDTSWVAVSNFKSTYSHYTESDNLVVRRVGNTVELRGYWKTSSNKAASTSATVFATLPEGYAPSRLVYSVQRTGSGLNKYYILVNASGELAWSHYGNTSTATLESGTRMYSFFSWFVE